jgi:general secretion pathway protein N
MSTRGAKLLSLILAVACGALFLIALALQLGLGRGYTWLEQEGDAVAISSGAIDRTPFRLAAESEFAATQARPLFNDDRKPTPDEPSDDNAAAPPSVPLNIALTGVVLTPSVRLAMVQDKAKNNSVALREGMPMPGDQGGWMLTKINPRSAIFRELSGEEVEVELTTAVANPKANAPARAPNAPATPAPPRPAPANPQTPIALPAPGAAASGAQPGGANQQEALQRRIEERRKQMRDEAERMKKQNMSPEQMREEMQRLQQSQPQQQ